jgi:hypothetical protein
MNIAFKDPIEQREGVDAIAHALFRPMGADGVYARTALYEQVVEGLSGLISRHREPSTEILRFPPVMSRRQLEKSGYLKSFPHLLGCVSCLHGSETEIRGVVEQFEAGKDWTPALEPADLVLSPAACYPVYPLAAGRQAVSCSTWLAIAFAASRRRISTGCSRSACANMSASAHPRRSATSANAG